MRDKKSGWLDKVARPTTLQGVQKPSASIFGRGLDKYISLESISREREAGGADSKNV